MSVLGSVMTTLFVPETGGRTLEEVDADCEVLREHDTLAEALARRALVDARRKHQQAVALTRDIDELRKNMLFSTRYGPW